MNPSYIPFSFGVTSIQTNGFCTFALLLYLCNRLLFKDVYKINSVSLSIVPI